MDSVTPFDPNRFQSAAGHYLAGRPPYPQRLIARVAGVCGIGPDSAVLDLGCGPGQLARAFAAYAGRVTGVDPSADMLQVARAEAAGTTVQFVEGSSYTLDATFGRLDLVAIGRAFHWMDRADTLRRLDALVAPGGAVVLFGDTHPNVTANAWRPAWRALVEDYSEARGGRAPGWVSNETMLLASPFAVLERVSAIETLATPVAVFAERTLSMSTTSRARIGGKADELASAMLALMESVATDGVVTEVVESTALIARRAA